LQVTKNFFLAEFTASNTATRLNIDNTPDPKSQSNLVGILIPNMQIVRDLLKAPVLVSSGYRSPKLNVAVNGAQSSQHSTGNACDFTCPGFGTAKEVCRFLALHAHFDQLIYEGTWVHISFVDRKQVLTATFSGGKATYSSGIV
jgi:hypothetical protein